jgi:hypothetical protein
MPDDNLNRHTDVANFLGDIDAGQFERLFGVSLSDVAAAVIDNQSKGRITLDFHVEPIPGSHQVLIKHSLKSLRPTNGGRAMEECTRKTAMHVGKYGRLSLVPESQGALFSRDGTPVAAMPPAPPTH